MGYNITVSCDRDGCNSVVQVPQVGANPIGWVQMAYATVNLAEGQKKAQPKHMIFCSWKCALHYCKSFVKEAVDKK